MKDSSATISGKRRPPVADREGELVLVRGARFTPALLLVATTWLGVGSSAWSFLAIPFLAIGWIGASPNLNFADGMLSYLSMIGGLILLQVHEPSGAAVLGGTAAAFYLSSLEMRLTAQPWDSGKRMGQPRRSSRNS